MKTLNVYTKDNKLIHTQPCDYVMSDELKGHGISGGSFLQNIPIIGGIAKLLGLGLKGQGISGSSLKSCGISGHGISGKAVHDINGGFLSALLPFVPTLLSAIPSVINMLKGEGITGYGFDEEGDYKFQFVSGKGVEHEEMVKINPLAIELLKEDPNLLNRVRDNIENKISARANGISAGISAKGISGGMAQSISQINTGRGISGGMSQSISQINTGRGISAGISGNSCGTSNGVYGGSFKSEPKVYKHTIGEF